MRAFFCFVVILGVLDAGLPVRIQSKYAVLINADTGAVLYDKNKDAKAYPASITKIATATYALKHVDDLKQLIFCPPECLVRISPKVKREHNYTHPSHWLEWDGTTFNILKGEVLPLYSLFHGMMLVSGNDAANVIAHHTSGNIAKFCDEMNAYLKTLECSSTQFQNPHGLHHPDHYTTAHDMARITQEALKDERFRKIVGSITHQRPKTNKRSAKMITQANRLLKKSTKFYYDRAFGVKSGYHSNAGYTLVAAAKHQGRTLIAVILQSPDPVQRYRDAIALFDAAFAEKKERRVLFKKNENTFRYEIASGQSALSAALRDNVFLDYYPSEEPELSSFLQWNIPHLPIRLGEVVGNLVVIDQQGHHLVEMPLIAKDSVEAKSWFSRNYARCMIFFCLCLFAGGFSCYRMWRWRASGPRKRP